jgi:hypothetical protein
MLMQLGKLRESTGLSQVARKSYVATVNRFKNRQIAEPIVYSRKRISDLNQTGQFRSMHEPLHD